jgi:hypothetical protein
MAPVVEEPKALGDGCGAEEAGRRLEMADGRQRRPTELVRGGGGLWAPGDPASASTTMLQQALQRGRSDAGELRAA